MLLLRTVIVRRDYSLDMIEIKIGPTESELNGRQSDLIRSLQPVIIPMKMFGIDLMDAAQPRSKSRRFASIFFGVAIIVAIEALNVLSEKSPLNELASSKNWLPILTEYSSLVWYTVYPLAMLEMLTLRKWKLLWKTMRKMEVLMEFSDAFHWRLRTFSAVMTIVLITLVNVFKLAY